MVKNIKNYSIYFRTDKPIRLGQSLLQPPPHQTTSMIYKYRLLSFHCGAEKTCTRNHDYCDYFLHRVYNGMLPCFFLGLFFTLF